MCYYRIKEGFIMKGNYYQPFSLRISEDMHHKLKIIAERHKRSENKEIEFALEEYVRRYEEAHGIISEQPTFPKSK